MAIQNQNTIDLIKAYFEGGNAKDKSANGIEADLRVIQKVIEEEKSTE